MKILAVCVVVMGRAWIALYRKISSAPMARERTEVLTMRLGSGKALKIAYALLKKKVADAPTVDAVVVTRCKDCVHWDDDPDTYGANCGPKGKCMKSFETMCADDFCSYGERKDGGDG